MARSPFYAYPSSSFYEYRLTGRHGPWYYGGTGETYPAGTYGMTIGCPAVADVNGDGRQDLIFAPHIFPHVEQHPPAYPTVLLGTTSGTLTSKSGFTKVASSLGRQKIYRFDVGDMNGDGINDIVASSHGAYPAIPGERQTLIFGSRTGLSDQTNRLPWHENGNDPKYLSRDVALGDIDADGDLDILFSGISTSGKKGFYLNEDNGARFTDISDRLPFKIGDPYSYTNGVAHAQGSIELADLNNDNAADIIAPYYRGSVNGFIALNDGRGQFPDSSVITMPKGIYGSNNKNDNIAVVDIDGDGFKDIILSQGQWNPYYVGRQLQVIKNHGGKTFTDESWRISGDKDRVGAKGHAEGNIFIIDFDADGDPDIFDATEPGDGVISNRLFLNDGKGHFTRAPDSMLPSVPKVNGNTTPNLVPINLGNKNGFDFVYFVLGGDSKTYSSLKAYLIKAKGLSLSGTAGGDKLSGGVGSDTLSGGVGNDVLNGGARNDRLKGGPDLDTLTGGSGKDTFVFSTGDTGTSRKSADYITDFSGRKGDKIDLKALDANMQTKGDQTFTFIGESSFTKAGQVRYSKSGGDTYVLFNTDKDATPEGIIRLKGSMDMTKDLFVL